jgi:AraC-like DNA-binding protein
MAKSNAKARHPAFIAGQVRDSRYFFLNLVPQSKGLTVACGGWERCAPDYRVQRSDFEFYGMEYVAKGRGLLTLNRREHKLEPGSLFVYKPRTAHIIQTDAGDPLVKYFVDFSGSRARAIFGAKVLGADGIADLLHSQPIHNIYEEMLAAGLKGGPLASRLCSLLLELLALRVEELAHSPADFQGRARQAFDRSRAELQKHFRKIQSVSELARLTHLDPAYLSRLYARFGGESPHEMLTRLKVNEAAAYLLQGVHSIKEVAALVGFSDPYHFSRVFKRSHGISPAAFQRAKARVSRGGIPAP